MNRSLDFSHFSTDVVLPEFSDEWRARLAHMPQTLERANSAVMFANQSANQSEPWISAAFLRAALADLCAMEEMQKIDRPASSSVRIANEQNPLLHLLILLRHLNIHVKTMIVETEHSAITFNGDPITFNGEPLTWGVLVIYNLSSSDLLGLRDGGKYEVSELEQCVGWFNERQRACGANRLVVQGVAMFAALLCERHAL